MDIQLATKEELTTELMKRGVALVGALASQDEETQKVGGNKALRLQSFFYGNDPVALIRMVVFLGNSIAEYALATGALTEDHINQLIEMEQQAYEQGRGIQEDPEDTGEEWKKKPKP